VHKIGELCPGAAVDLISADITPMRPGRSYEYLFCSTVTGVLTVILRKTGETDRPQKQYGGASLAADASYPGRFPVPWGWSVNFQFSGAAGAGNVYDLDVYEVLT
jgi:hypothetical protein